MQKPKLNFKKSLQNLKNFVQEYKVIVISLLTAVLAVLLLIFAAPWFQSQYDTSILIPFNLTQAEKNDYMVRLHDVLTMKDKGKNNCILYNEIGILRLSLKDYSGAWTLLPERAKPARWTRA